MNCGHIYVPLRDQYELVVQERDSLKLVLQLVSKDLYFQSKKNEDKDKPCASPTNVQKVPDLNKKGISKLFSTFSDHVNVDNHN